MDFDLEVPGLDAFDLPKPEGIVPGVVDFVGECLATGRAPAIERFVLEPEGVGRDEGGINSGLWRPSTRPPEAQPAEELPSGQDGRPLPLDAKAGELSIAPEATADRETLNRSRAVGTRSAD